MKQCCSCKKIKSLEEFSWRNKASNIKARECKDCHKLIRKNYYQKNKTTEIARVANRRKELRNWIKLIKNELECEKCGYNTNPQILHFHHIEDKRKNISEMASDGNSIEVIFTEMLKCQILCPNCHMEIHSRL